MMGACFAVFFFLYNSCVVLMICLMVCVARACRIIVETDPTTIASRVSRPRADTTDIVINEQTILNAYQTVKEKMQQRIGQF